MTKRFYIQLLALITLLCYPSNISADDYSLAPSTGRKVYVPIDAESAKGQLLVTNYGRTPVQNFTYKLSFQGTVLYEKKYVMKEPLRRMDVGTIAIDVPPDTKLSKTELQIEITKVNGEANTATFPYANLPRITVTQVPHRRIVVEEYTGMWCQYCPRGIALMKNLERNYPENFIGIAIHITDPLTCSDYAWNAAAILRYPTLQMNRSRLLSNFTAVTEFEEEMAMGADMDVDVTAQWDKAKENVTITPRVTFRTTPQGKPYAIAYVLTEDGKANTAWVQNNHYSGDTGLLGISTELDQFINSPRALRGYPNDFTAVAARGVYNPGEEYLIKNPIEIDKPQSFNQVFNVSQIRLLHDKTKLKVCVLLINTANGQIENAAKCSITDAAPAGISPVKEGQNTAVEVARYTLDGRRLHGPQRGINLVKYSNGRVCKEVVSH